MITKTVQVQPYTSLDGTEGFLVTAQYRHKVGYAFYVDQKDAEYKAHSFNLEPNLYYFDYLKP